MANVTVTSSDSAKLWDAVNGNVVRTLDFGTEWEYFSESSDEYGVNWYNVGTDEYVTDLDVSESVQSVSQESGTLTVTAAGIMAQYSVNGRPWQNKDALTQGEQYQYFTVAIDSWGGYNYDLGGNQWVQGTNTNDPANPNSAQGTYVEISFYDPRLTNPDMDYSGVAANLNVFPRGTRLKIVLDDPLDGQTVIERVVNDTGTYGIDHPYWLDIAWPNNDIPSYGRTHATVYVES